MCILACQSDLWLEERWNAVVWMPFGGELDKHGSVMGEDWALSFLAPGNTTSQSLLPKLCFVHVYF